MLSEFLQLAEKSISSTKAIQSYSSRVVRKITLTTSKRLVGGGSGSFNRSVTEARRDLELSHGLPASEVLGLNVGDYDGMRLTTKEVKDDSTVTVPLAKESRVALDDYLEWRRQQGESMEFETPLFVGQGHNSYSSL